MPRCRTFMWMVAFFVGCGTDSPGVESSAPMPGTTSTATTTATTATSEDSEMSSGGMGTASLSSASSSTGETGGDETSPTSSTGAETASAGSDTSQRFDVPQLGPVLPDHARYMMAGDSITDWGHLWRSGVVMGLQAQGLSLETVGPYTDEAGHHHAGLASQQTSFILQNMPAWLDQHDPNVINLLIGVNDIRGGVPTETIAANMISIVQTIHDAEPECFVFVNSVMRYDGSYGGDPSRVPEINAAYLGIVEAFTEQGVPIHWVDLYPHVPADEIGDGIHPSLDSEGAALMTEVVLGEMLPLIP